MVSRLKSGLYEEAKTRALRVLLVRVGAMGDVLHAVPAAAALRQSLPNCFLGWAVEPRWKDLLIAQGADRGPIVDRIHLAATKLWKRRPFAAQTLGEIAALRKEMRAERYDVCIDLQGSIKSAVIGRLAGARHFVGPQEAREGLANLLYKDRVRTSATHVVVQACQLVSAGVRSVAGVAEELTPQPVELPVDRGAERWCSGKLAELGGDGSEFVLLAPTAGWGAKQWPVERYRGLSARLAGAGYKVLVNAGGKGDLKTALAVVQSGPAAVVACDIAQLIALTRRASLVVGGDTGPVHLAAALGRPVLALYGPTDPHRNGPFFPGSRCRVLRHAESLLNHKRSSQTEAGLAQITEEEVETSALQVMQEARANA